jgi:hypothetical protein
MMWSDNLWMILNRLARARILWQVGIDWISSHCCVPSCNTFFVRALPTRMIDTLPIDFMPEFRFCASNCWIGLTYWNGWFYAFHNRKWSFCWHCLHHRLMCKEEKRLTLKDLWVFEAPVEDGTTWPPPANISTFIEQQKAFHAPSRKQFVSRLTTFIYQIIGLAPVTSPHFDVWSAFRCSKFMAHALAIRQ